MILAVQQCSLPMAGPAIASATHQAAAVTAGVTAAAALQCQ